MPQEQKKLGPSVTYTNPEGGAKVMSVAGLVLKEGQSVNLVEKLGEARAQPLLQKLAKNPHFRVDGGEDWSKKKEQKPAGDLGPDEQLANQAVAREAEIRRTQGDKAADEYLETLDDYGRVQPGKGGGGGGQEAPTGQRPREGEPPAGVQMPDEATLETPSRRRRE